MTQYIIGRGGNQPFSIPSDKTLVSHEHALLQIDDYGRWTITDNNSANGVYVRNSDGDYERVFQTEITPTTVVRLGPENVRSFEFWAQRVVAEDQNDYSTEFQALKSMLAEYKDDEAKIEKKTERYNWIASCSGAVASLLFMVYYFLTQSSGKGMDSNGVMYRMMAMSTIPVIIKACLPKPAKQLRAMREKRSKIIRCPRCGNPLSDHAVNQGFCPVCKAC